MRSIEIASHKGDEVIADFVPRTSNEQEDQACVVREQGISVAEWCDRILRELRAHQLVFQPSLSNGEIVRELQQEESRLRKRLAAAFHRLVVLDVAHGVDSEGRFSLASFYKYAFHIFERTFDIPRTETYHEQDLLQILKDEPTSLICLVNVHLAQSGDRKRLRSLTQERHPCLILFDTYGPPAKNTAPPTQAFLVISDLLGSSLRRVAIADGMTTIGRHPDCTIQIKDRHVSRRHAVITRNPDGFVIKDQGSQIGTLVNDRPIAGSHYLCAGDKVRIGSVELLFGDGSSDTTALSELGDVDEQQVEFDFVDSGLESVAEFQALIRIEKAIGDAMTFRDVSRQLTAGLLDLFSNADLGVVMLLNASNDLVVGWASTGEAYEKDRQIRISRNKVHEAIRSKMAILWVAGAKSRDDGGKSSGDTTPRSMMCVPLISATGDVFGAIQLGSKAGSIFSKDDLDLFAYLSRGASTALHRALCHDQSA